MKMMKMKKNYRRLKKKEKNQLENSYRKFQYLIENINKEKNFKLKLIYLNLYLNVIDPKSEIIKQIDDLKKAISSNKEKITITNNELKTTKEDLLKQVPNLLKQILNLLKQKQNLIKLKIK